MQEVWVRQTQEKCHVLVSHPLRRLQLNVIASGEGSSVEEACLDCEKGLQTQITRNRRWLRTQKAALAKGSYCGSPGDTEEDIAELVSVKAIVKAYRQDYLKKAK